MRFVSAIGRACIIAILMATFLCFRSEVAVAQAAECVAVAEHQSKIREFPTYVAEKSMTDAEVKVALALLVGSTGSAPANEVTLGYLVARIDGAVVFFYGDHDAICGAYVIPPPMVPAFLQALEGAPA